LKEAVMEKAAWFLAGFVAGWLGCCLLVKWKTRGTGGSLNGED